jgi:hypothetical protein
LIWRPCWMWRGFGNSSNQYNLVHQAAFSQYLATVNCQHGSYHTIERSWPSSLNGPSAVSAWACSNCLMVTGRMVCSRVALYLMQSPKAQHKPHQLVGWSHQNKPCHKRQHRKTAWHYRSSKR